MINQNIKVRYISPSPHIKLEFHSNYSLYLQWDGQGQLNLKYKHLMIIDCWQQRKLFFSSRGLQSGKRLFHGRFLQTCKEFPTRTLVFTIKLTGPPKTGQPLNIVLLKFPQPLMAVANKECSIQIGIMIFLQLQN